MNKVVQPHAGAAFAATAVGEGRVWGLRVLGGFELDDGQQRLTRLRSRAAMALIVRLALAPNRDHAREELAALLWPQAPADASRSRLRQTLSLLKAVLEPPGGGVVIVADKRVLRLAPGAVWCDAVAFEQAARTSPPEWAAGLYAGELMPGFYDEWLVDERQRLQGLAERVIESANAASARDGGVPSPGRGPAPHAPAASAARATPAPGLRLPQYLTRLIGADQPGARLQALVSRHRLVAVLGAGGCGKTRLGVQIARLLSEPVPTLAPPRFERAFFVSLVGAVDPTALLDRLALALRVPASGDVAEQLLPLLDGRRVLLLLDNCEQLNAAAAAIVAHLAERLPQAHFLITSRRPLGLDGERLFQLETLDLPHSDATLPELVMNPAVALFVDRARAHRADFHVNATNQAGLAGLVHWLEGLPLAIELAASHARTLGPAELLVLLQAERAQRQAGGLAFLARRGNRSGNDPRHACMLDVIAWSWQLLSPEARQLLLALCLMPAGATLPMATGLGAVTGPQAGLAATQTLLDELVAQSVVRASAGQDGQWRYAPLETVREYGLAQHDPALQKPLRRRVLDSLLHWARALPATPPLPTVRDELPNLSAALVAAPADGDADDAVLLVLLLQSAWGEIAVPAGVLETLDLLLQSSDVSDSHAAAGHALAATSCQEGGRREDAQRHRSAALARPCPDIALRAMVLSRTARLYWRIEKDPATARALAAEALPLARQAARPNTEASLLSLLGHLATVADGDTAAGKALSAQAAALWARSGNQHLTNAGRYNVAVQTLEAGRPAEALPEFIALEAIGRELQDWDLAAGSLEARGTALLRLRRWAESAACLRECLTVAWEGLEMQAAVYGLWNIPPALARMRRGELAAQTMGAAQALWVQRFGQMDRRDLRDLKRVRRFTRVLLGADAAEQAWRTGAARPLGEAVRVLLAALPPAR